MNKKKQIRSCLAIFFVFLFLIQGFIPAYAASGRTTCYTIGTSNTTVYQDTSLKKKLGTVYASDELIVELVTGSYCRITYKITGTSRTKTGYIPTSAILRGTTGSSYAAKGKITTFARPGSSVYGSISIGDQVKVLGKYGDWVQVKYPVSSGYKYAFISSSDANTYLYNSNSGSNSGSSQNSISNSSGSWQYPTSNSYVCGNNWGQYYAPRAAAGRPNHCGIDIKSRTGNTAIYAAASGTVVKTGWNSSNGYYVVIQHSLSGKTVYSFYAHLSAIKKNSGTVQKGQQIGVIGNTGSGSRGTHLHFAVVDKLWAGSYYGYVPYFTGNKVTYSGVTYYNPHYIVQYNSLP